MAPTLDSTLSGATSNSYIALSTATAIAQNLPFADKWNDTSDDVIAISGDVARREADSSRPTP